MTQTATTQATDEPEIQRVFQSKAETKAFYDKISHVYDLLAEHSEGPVRRAGLEKLDARPGEKVLEIGFGTGHCLVSLAQSVGPTGKVYGLDLSEGMLDVARDNLHKAGLADRVELTCGDAVQLALPAGFAGRDLHELYPGTVRHAGDPQGAGRVQASPAAGGADRGRGGFQGRRRRRHPARLRVDATGISPTWWTAARSSSAVLGGGGLPHRERGKENDVGSRGGGSRGQGSMSPDDSLALDTAWRASALRTADTSRRRVVERGRVMAVRGSVVEVEFPEAASIVLSRTQAAQGLYPAVDPLAS